jgi:hypothetical protein
MIDDRRADRLAAAPLGKRLRTLVPPMPTTSGYRPSSARNLAFTLAFVAVVLTFLLPGNFLVNIGAYSETAGGNPLTKFHPATYMTVFAAWLALYGGRNRGGFVALFRDRPALAWSVALIVISILYSALMIGVNGIALYVETYLAPALLLVALETGTERQLRILGYTILVFALVNVLISLMEGRAEVHLIAPTVGTAGEGLKRIVDKGVDEFRGAALYSHPLTGSLVTSMVLFLALGMRLRAWLSTAVLVALIIGLLSFGGRSALATTLTLITSAALFQLSAGLVTRRLDVGFLMAFIAGSLLLPVLLMVVSTTTDIGQRIFTHLYLDDSADVRTIQWQILHYLNLHDVLFGVSVDRQVLLKVQVGLMRTGTDIENFWLLIFLGLGLVGFPVLVGALFLLLWHQGRRANTPIGWMIVTVTLFICSTSNSLGRKTPDLVFLAACMAALTGFRLTQQEQEQVPQPAEQPADPGRRTALTGSPLEDRVRSLAGRPRARPARALLTNPGRP